jgi:hypothetical protein
MAQRILKLAEVDLKVSESEKIAQELLALVRKKSRTKPIELPASDAELRRQKGITARDVLKILSLSLDGYRILRKRGRDAVRPLSRLHRLCEKTNVREDLIPELCRLKTNWDAWRVDERHQNEHTELASLKNACLGFLSENSGKDLSYSAMEDEARDIASKYASRFSPSPPLDYGLVIGHMLALVANMPT